MGPARALKEREKFKKSASFFLKVTHFSPKSLFLFSRQHFLIKNSVLQVSGPDTLQNAIKITLKTKFSTHFVQIPSHLLPALSYSLQYGSYMGLARDPLERRRPGPGPSGSAKPSIKCAPSLICMCPSKLSPFK